MEHDDHLEDKGIGEIKGGIAGHPSGLMTLFISEMWERFCYYGMRTLLILYLTKSLLKGDAEASLIYGAYTGLVYAAPILGGRMADKFLGYRWAVILGGILMAIGEFLILGGTEKFLTIGMGALIIGNGYFKANISTIVGKLYKDGDTRRDSGFTIFYIGINVGALLATTVVAYVGETYGFDKGFALAGFGMLAGIGIFYMNRKSYAQAPGLEVTEAGLKKVAGPINMAVVVSVLSLLLIPACYFLIQNNSILDYIFLALFIIVSFTLIQAGIKEGRIWRDRMIALIIFMLINIVFWACFEQAGTSLTLFADRCVNRSIFGWNMPASMTQFFNPAFIIIFGSIFSMMWIKLTKIGKNPSIPMKFAFGILQLGLGFLLTYVGFKFESDFQVPLLTLVFLYMLHTTGELFLSPIGLSMVTKLSPKKMAGTAMGAWFLGFAIANFLGGKIAAFTGGGHGADDGDQSKFSKNTTLKEAIEMSGDNTVNFEDWVTIGKDLPKNITLSSYMNAQDWVEARKSFEGSVTVNQWLSNRSINKEIKTAKEWLDLSQWKELQADYSALLKSDSLALVANEEAEILGMKDWLYFSPDLDKSDKTASFAAAFETNKTKILETKLSDYIDVFTVIGFVLIGFSVLIMLINAPLKKLMHGVE